MIGTPGSRAEALSPASLAGAAILLEIGAEYDVVDALRGGAPVDPQEAARRTGIPAVAMRQYLEALVTVGLAETVRHDGQQPHFRETPLLAQLVHDVGFLSWGLRACEPLIAHAREFATAMVQAQSLHPRDGGLVARTSRWMGEKAFYPQAERTMLALRPTRIVDFGSGSGQLLIKLLKQLPGATAVGIDINSGACEQARAAGAASGLSDRLTIFERPIQSLVHDPEPLQGADVIHAGWVFHDLLPTEESALDEILAVCCRTASTGTLVIVEGVPYATEAGEALFSAAYTFLHEGFMGRRLLTEAAWRKKLESAGFTRIEVEQLGIPGGRLFAANAR